MNTTDSNLGLIDEIKGDYQSAEKKYFSVYQRRLKSKKPEDILYSISQLIAVNFLKGDINSAENKFEQLKQYYSENKNNQESNSLFTRNYGYGYFVSGAYYQSKKKL